MTIPIAMVVGAVAGIDQRVALDLLLILGCAGVVGVAFGKLRLAPIPGYLIAGLVLGLFIEPSETIGAVTQLATVLLLFTIGMHLDLSWLKRGGSALVIAGVLSTLLSVLILTPAAMLVGMRLPGAIAAGMALSLSSTAVVMRLMQQRRELRQPAGRISLGVLLIQDVLVIGMLALIPTLAAWDSSLEGGAPSEDSSEGISLLALLGRVVGLALLIAGSVVLLPRITQVAAKVSSEVLLVLSAAAGLSAAVATAALGLSPELGAFTAGLVLAGTPVRFQVAGQLAPLRDLFMAVFFTAIGLSVEIGLIAEQWWPVLLGAVGVVAVKAWTIGFAAWVSGSSPSVAGRAGLSLAQAGEFSIIVIVAAFGAGLIDERQNAAMLGTIILTLIVTPTLISRSISFGRLLSQCPMPPWHRAKGGGPGTEGESHDARAVIIGFGPVGRAVAERLESADVPYVIVELNPQTVRTQHRLGRRAVYGDATNIDVLESAGVAESLAVVVSIADDDAMLRACRIIRRLAPETCLVCRAGTASAANLARTLGATEVIVDELATAQTMSHRVLDAFSLEDTETATSATSPDAA